MIIIKKRHLRPLKGAINSLRELKSAYRSNRFNAWIPPTAEEMRKTPPRLLRHAIDIQADPKREIFNYRFLDQILKDTNGNDYKWKPQYQKRGTCVGQGAKLACDIIMAINAIVKGVKFPGRAAVAGTYPGSRVDIAGQPGSWDGSNGSWVNKWVLKYGILLLSDLEGVPEDATDVDERIAVNWTNTREGVPTEYENEAKKRPVKEGYLVTDFDEAAAGLRRGGCIINCSNLIPSGKRDSNGFSPASRSGGHCTVYSAVRTDIDGMLYQNSWGPNWGSGPKYPFDQPPGSVWESRRDVNATLAQGDSYVFFGVNGLEPVDDFLGL